MNSTKLSITCAAVAALSLSLGCGEAGGSTTGSAATKDSGAPKTPKPSGSSSAAASTQPTSTPPPPSGPPSVGPASSGAASASPSSAPVSGASGSPPVGGPPESGASLAELFKDSPAEGTNRPIFLNNVASGVIMIVPKEFGEGSGVYGSGYSTGTSENGAAKCRVGFTVEQLPGIDETVPKLNDTQLKQLCYSNGQVDNVKWEPSADVKLGPDGVPAIVWRGKGTMAGSKGDWGALAVSAVFQKNKRVAGCGGWTTDKPELEKGVIQTLRTLRIGAAMKTPPGNP